MFHDAVLQVHPSIIVAGVTVQYCTKTIAPRKILRLVHLFLFKNFDCTIFVIERTVFASGKCIDHHPINGSGNWNIVSYGGADRR